MKNNYSLPGRTLSLGDCTPLVMHQSEIDFATYVGTVRLEDQNEYSCFVSKSEEGKLRIHYLPSDKLVIKLEGDAPVLIDSVDGEFPKTIFVSPNSESELEKRLHEEMNYFLGE